MVSACYYTRALTTVPWGREKGVQIITATIQESIDENRFFFVSDFKAHKCCS